MILRLRRTLFRLRTGPADYIATWTRLTLKSQPFAPRTASTNHSPCPAVMHSPQKRKRKHLTNRKFPRKQTPWNSHRPTPDGAVHRLDGTTNITSLYRTLKKKKTYYYAWLAVWFGIASLRANIKSTFNALATYEYSVQNRFKYGSH